MKKMFLFAAAVAALTLASCVKSTVNAPEGTTTITLKIAGAQSTRAIETAAGDPTKAPTLANPGNHYVYVIDAGTIIHLETLNTTTAITPAAGQVIGATAGEGGGQKYFPDSSEVFVLCNIPSDVNPADYGVGTEANKLYTAVSTISYTAKNNDIYATPAMANESGAAVKVIPSGANAAIAEFKIKPLFSRIEFKEIKAGTHIKSYKLKGVYLNNYNIQFKMDGKGVTESLQATTTNPPYKTGWFGDYTTPIGSTADGNVTKALAPATGKVWAYNVAPGSIPTFILELTDIVQYPDNDGTPNTASPSTVSGTKYVTVTGYTGMDSATFMRGKIYQVDTINFNFDDLKDIVTPSGVAITAKVEIVNWDFLPLTPVLSK